MQDFLFVKDGRTHIRVLYSEILYAEAINRYVRLITTDHKVYLAKCYLSDLATMLPPELFCRVHRSYIVSIRQISRFSDASAYLGEVQIPIGKQYRRALPENIVAISGSQHLTKQQINDLFKPPDPACD